MGVRYTLNISYILVFSLLFSGCSTLPFVKSTQEKKEDVVRKIDVTNNELEERSRELTALINDLGQKAEARTSPPATDVEQIVKILAEEDERLEGSPIRRVDVQEVLERFQEDKEKLLRDFKKAKRDNTGLLEQVRNLERENSSLAIQLDRESKKTIFDRLWSWLMSLSFATLIIGGLMIVVLGPAAIPIIFQFAAFIVTKIPSVVGFLGVISKNTFDSVVKGVQDAKSTLRSFPDDRTFNKDEVISLLNNSLEKHTNNNTKVLVSRRKEKIL